MDTLWLSHISYVSVTVSQILDDMDVPLEQDNADPGLDLDIRTSRGYAYDTGDEVVAPDQEQTMQTGKRYTRS